MVGVADKALENAFRWLDSARMNYERGNMNIAVYCLEMSFEIGMKSLMQKMRSDFPKSHSIEDLFVITVEKNPHIDQKTKTRLQSYVGDFRTLLRLRNAAGYGFEYKNGQESMKSVFEATNNNVESFLGCVKDAIEVIEKKH